MSDQDDPILHQAEQSRLKQQLAWRLGIAAALIVIVLAAIWFLDHVQQNNDTPQITTTPQIAPIASAAAEHASAPVSAPASAVTASAAQPVASAVAASDVAATATATPGTPTPAAAAPKTANAAVTTSNHSAPAPTATPVLTPAAEPASRQTAPAAAATSTKPTEPPLALPAGEKTVEPQAAPATPGKFEVHAGSNGYTVQAGVFLHASNADKLLTQLQNAGVPAWLETRVQIGPFKNKADAEAAIRKLRKLGIEPVVRENQ